MKKIYFLKIILFLCLFSSAAQAQTTCQAAINPIPSSYNFGLNTTTAVATTSINTATSPSAYMIIQCNVTLALNLLSSGTTITYQLLDNLVMTNGTRTIGLQFSHDSNFSPNYSNAGGGTTLGSSYLLNLSLLGTQGLRIPIYVRTTPKGTWPKAGTYSGTFRISISGSICTLGIGVCITSVAIGPNLVTTFSTSITVAKYCEFISVAPTASLGTVGSLSDVVGTTIPLQIRCGQDEDFTISSNNGQHYNGTSRRLASTINNYVTYNIYHPGSSTQILTSTNTYAALATGVNQTFNIPVNIPQGQSTPPAGVYSDTVTFTVEY